MMFSLLFTLFLFVEMGGMYRLLANSVVRTDFFIVVILLYEFDFLDFICPKFYHGVLRQKNGGTYSHIFPRLGPL